MVFNGSCTQTLELVWRAKRGVRNKSRAKLRLHPHIISSSRAAETSEGGRRGRVHNEQQKKKTPLGAEPRLHSKWGK